MLSETDTCGDCTISTSKVRTHMCMVTWPAVMLCYCTALRKLTEKAAKVECKAEKRNVIQQYSNFDSQVYAPMTRIGVYLDSGSEQYNVKSKLTNTLDGACVCA